MLICDVANDLSTILRSSLEKVEVLIVKINETLCNTYTQCKLRSDKSINRFVDAVAVRQIYSFIAGNEYLKTFS